MTTTSQQRRATLRRLKDTKVLPKVDLRENKYRSNPKLKKTVKRTRA